MTQLAGGAENSALSLKATSVGDSPPTRRDRFSLIRTYCLQLKKAPSGLEEKSRSARD